jgi:hypothetical protein
VVLSNHLGHCRLLRGAVVVMSIVLILVFASFAALSAYLWLR